MIIPEDGALPQITRKGFEAFNNVMVIKIPQKLKQGKMRMNFMLATLDRSKPGERWPADQCVDVVMNSTSNEARSTENASNCTDNNNSKIAKKLGNFDPKRFKTISRNFNDLPESNQKQVINSSPPIVSTNNANFNHQFIPNTFQDHQVPHRRFDDHHIQYNDRTFDNDPQTYRYPNNQQYGGHDNLLGEGTSSNPIAHVYGVQNQIINTGNSREPMLEDRSFNREYFPGNPPLYPNTFVTSPQENNFNRAGISNPNFREIGRTVDGPFIQNIPDAYGANNYNEGPRKLNFERGPFPFHNSNRPESTFINNNFERPPYHHDSGLNNFKAQPLLNSPPLLPLPPPLLLENFNNEQFQNNSNVRNPHFDQKMWNDRNQPNSHYRRKNRNGFKSWRGRGAPNKFLKVNNKRRNNSLQKNKY